MNKDLENLKDLYEIYKLYTTYNQRNRRWWIRPINTNRNSFGYFSRVFKTMKNKDPEEFFIHTRMSRSQYDLLLMLVEPHLTKLSIRPSIQFECRLPLTLTFLSQGVSIKYLSWSYKMGRTTVRKIILETCDVLWTILSPLYVNKPNTQDYQQIAEEFENKWNMPHCVGAIDGKHINIRCPAKTGSSFFNYKKTFSVVLLASCDANYIFTDVCVGAYGSQSDGGVLQQSKFGKQILNEEVPIPAAKVISNSNRIFPFYFVGDAAFPLRKNLMRPYPGRLLDTPKLIFNYRLSGARRVIENAFGVLVARWRILNTTINMKPENVEKIVLATIALHNFIKLNGEAKKYTPTTFIDWEDSDHNIHSGTWRNDISQPLRSVRMGSNNASRTAFELRDVLKDYFINEGAVSFQYERC